MQSVANDVERYIRRENPELNRFATLTLPGEGLEAGDTFTEQLPDFLGMLDELGDKLEARKGESIEWVGGVEPQSNENPHAHLLIDDYVDRSWLERAWRECGDGDDRGGYVHIKQADGGAAAVADYIVGYVNGPVVGNVVV
jgi:hypothetical protein